MDGNLALLREYYCIRLDIHTCVYFRYCILAGHMLGEIVAAVLKL